MSTESDIREILADNRKTEDKVAALVAYIEGFELIDEAYPRNTHAEVEQVRIYGLDLGIDANGYASRVTFPDGAQT